MNKRPDIGFSGKAMVLFLGTALLYAFTGDRDVGSALFIACLILAASHLWHGPE